MRIPVAGCLIVVSIAAPALAAEGAGPASGPRLRVTSPTAPSGHVVGTLVGIDDDALTLRASGQTGDVRLKRESIAKLEVSRKRGNRGKAMIVGFLVGAAAGAVLGASTISNNDAFITPEEAAAILAILGAPTGALLGLACSHGEKWETTTPDRLHVAITPTRGGLAVGVSFAF